MFWRSNVLAFTQRWWFLILWWTLFFRNTSNPSRTWNLIQRVGELSRAIICWLILALLEWYLLQEMFVNAERLLKGIVLSFLYLKNKQKQSRTDYVFLSHRTSSRHQFHWVTSLWTAEEFLCTNHEQRFLVGLKPKLCICLSYKPWRRLGDILGQLSSVFSVRECCSLFQQLIQISQAFVKPALSWSN